MREEDIFAYYEERTDLLIIGVRGQSEYKIQGYKMKLISQRADLKIKTNYDLLKWAKEEDQSVDYDEIKELPKLLNL